MNVLLDDVIYDVGDGELLCTLRQLHTLKVLSLA